MVFKLAGDRAFDAPMPGIVNAGRHLVCQKSVGRVEKLDRENANVIELLQNSSGELFRLCLQRR